MRIFRLRSLSAANATAVVIGGIAFSQFFLLTLYMQDVLGYSAIRTGVGFAAITFTIIVFSNVAQRLVTRSACAGCSPPGSCWTPSRWRCSRQLPADGHYFWNLFPGLLVSGIGLALSFVPVTIAGLTGVEPGRRGHRVGPDQHQPPGRRRGGPGGGLDDRRGLRHDRHRPPSRPSTTASRTASRSGSWCSPEWRLLGAAIAATLLAPQPAAREVEILSTVNTSNTLEEAA